MQNPNVVAIIVEHDGSWGPNVELPGQTMKTFFDSFNRLPAQWMSHVIALVWVTREPKRFQAKIGGGIFYLYIQNVAFDNLKLMLALYHVCNDKFNVSRHVGISWFQRSQVDCKDCHQNRTSISNNIYQAHNLPETLYQC